MIKLQLCENYSNHNGRFHIKQTLKRIGLIKRQEKLKPALFQTAYLINRNNSWFLAHFKELYGDKLTDEDNARLLNIASLLEQWGYIDDNNDEYWFDKRIKLVVLKKSELDNYLLISTHKERKNGKKKD